MYGRMPTGSIPFRLAVSMNRSMRSLAGSPAILSTRSSFADSAYRPVNPSGSGFRVPENLRAEGRIQPFPYPIQHVRGDVIRSEGSQRLNDQEAFPHPETGLLQR